MKKYYFFILFSSLLGIGAKAQAKKQDPAGKASTAKTNTLSLGLCFPVGAFKRSHTGGIAIDYFRSKHRYGDDAAEPKLINFVMNAGASYNVGKSIAIAGYESRYGGYFTAYTMAGIDCKPAMAANVSLTTGPVMSIYKGGADIGFGVRLLSSYFFLNTIAFGPGISYNKFSKTDALWLGTIRASYAF